MIAYQVTCIRCGQQGTALPDFESRPCEHCGLPLPKVCQLCSQVNHPAARFCENCGESGQPWQSPKPVPAWSHPIAPDGPAYCRHCGDGYRPGVVGVAFCRTCGQGLPGGVKREEAPPFKFCTACGADLKGGRVCIACISRTGLPLP